MPPVFIFGAMPRIQILVLVQVLQEEAVAPAYRADTADAELHVLCDQFLQSRHACRRMQAWWHCGRAARSIPRFTLVAAATSLCGFFSTACS